MAHKVSQVNYISDKDELGVAWSAFVHVLFIGRCDVHHDQT